MRIQNPVLKGFNPDPSICRVGDDYYIAVSTFEWFPGVVIHHSKDLINWHQVSRPLKTVEHIDMRGNPDSGGVWAPQLSYSDGKFWLIYSDVKVVDGPWKDGTNYLTMCETIDGDWSKPIYLNQSGFDPSLFHDEDGRKWLTNMIWDNRVDHHNFAGIALQEYSPQEQKLIGEPINIFQGTEVKLVEAPHLYKKDGYYYLFTAEGGTLFNHQETVARSRNLKGPYEVHPNNPLITSFYHPTIRLQRAGHGSIVETQDGQWYFAHLTSRPLENELESVLDDRGYSPLGRETAIQKLEWRDGWPYIEGGNYPKDEVDGPGLPEVKWPADFPEKDDFDQATLNHQWNTVRIPFTEQMGNLTERPGHLRLIGGGSFHNHFSHSFVARRWQSLEFEAETKVAFNPVNFQQQAGLVSYYNTNNWTSLHVTYDPEFGKVLDLLRCERRDLSRPLKHAIPIPNDVSEVYLKVVVSQKIYNYAYSFDGQAWVDVEVDFDSRKLSDEFIREGGFFTGAFVGVNCIDTSGQKIAADFDYFKYKEK